MNFNPPMEDATERLEPYDDPECDAEEYKATIRDLRAQVVGLQSALAAGRCFHCGSALPIRSFQCADLTEGRSFCNVHCWILEAKDRAREVF